MATGYVLNEARRRLDLVEDGRVLAWYGPDADTSDLPPEAQALQFEPTDPQIIQSFTAWRQGNPEARTGLVNALTGYNQNFAVWSAAQRQSGTAGSTSPGAVSVTPGMQGTGALRQDAAYVNAYTTVAQTALTAEQARHQLSQREQDLRRAWAKAHPGRPFPTLTRGQGAAIPGTTATGGQALPAIGNNAAAPAPGTTGAVRLTPEEIAAYSRLGGVASGTQIFAYERELDGIEQQLKDVVGESETKDQFTAAHDRVQDIDQRIRLATEARQRDIVAGMDPARNQRRLPNGATITTDPEQPVWVQIDNPDGTSQMVPEELADLYLQRGAADRTWLRALEAHRPREAVAERQARVAPRIATPQTPVAGATPPPGQPAPPPPPVVPGYAPAGPPPLAQGAATAGVTQGRPQPRIATPFDAERDAAQGQIEGGAYTLPAYATGGKTSGAPRPPRSPEEEEPMTLLAPPGTVVSPQAMQNPGPQPGGGIYGPNNIWAPTGGGYTPHLEATAGNPALNGVAGAQHQAAMQQNAQAQAAEEEAARLAKEQFEREKLEIERQRDAKLADLKVRAQEDEQQFNLALEALDAETQRAMAELEAERQWAKQSRWGW